MKILGKIPREPLLYLLPLLAIVFLIIIFDKPEISDIKITRNGKTENIQFPYSVDMADNEVFFISFNLPVKNKSMAKFNVIPDNCIQEIFINGKNFPLDGIKGLCDWSKGAYIDFSKYVQKGLNNFGFRIMNTGGPGGLHIEIPNRNLKSLSLIHCIFALLFLISGIFVLKKFKFNLTELYISLPLFCLVFYALFEFCCRLLYELSEPTNWDSDIYFAVGRGIVNGIKPWSGLWDIKPPGVFLLSAVSFKIFDSAVFCHWFQCFVLIALAAFPLILHFVLPNRSVWRLLGCCLFGLTISLYAAERAGEVQTESLGAAFACLSIFAFAYPNFYKRKILWISISAFGLLGACGFKEPFLFPILGASILLCKDIKDWLTRFLLPLGIAIVTGFLFLVIAGWLGDFLHYLDFMQQIHANRHGSPFRRAMEFWRLWEDLNGFSWGLGWIIVALLFAPFVLYRNNLPQVAVKTLVAFLLASYTVGMGGEFFDHHFAFAVPFYFALWIMLSKKWGGDNKIAGSLILIFLSIAVLNLPDLKLEKREKEMRQRREILLEEAAYVDAVLDKAHIDRYMYLGQNDFVSKLGTNFLFGRTRHSPEGPYFFQFQHVWFNEIPGYKETILEMLENSQIVVRGHMPNLVANLTEPTLNEYFTLQPWESVAGIPRKYKHFGEYSVYFRKR